MEKLQRPTPDAMTAQRTFDVYTARQGLLPFMLQDVHVKICWKITLLSFQRFLIQLPHFMPTICPRILTTFGNSPQRTMRPCSWSRIVHCLDGYPALQRRPGKFVAVLTCLRLRWK